MIEVIKIRQFFLLICLLIFSLSANASNFRLNSGAPESLSNDRGDAFYNLLAAEIFKRMHLNYTYIRLPSSRALIQVNKGIDDGNIARVDGIDKKWRNLIKVPESILVWEFIAFSDKSSINITDWKSLKDYRVGYVRGWQIYEKHTKNVKEQVVANDPEHLFLILKRGRIDVALFERSQSRYWFKRIQYSPKMSSRSLARKQMYIYLHKKHKKLIPQMVNVVTDIKKDGSYQKIYTQAFKILNGE